MEKLTLNKLFDMFLQENKGKITKTRLYKYKVYNLYMKKIIGNLCISDLTLQDLYKIREDIDHKCSSYYPTPCMDMDLLLRDLYDFAKGKNLIHCPSNHRMNNREYSPKRKGFLFREDQVLIVRELFINRDLNQLLPYFVLLADGKFKPSTILNIKWKDINLDNHRIQIYGEDYDLNSLESYVLSYEKSKQIFETKYVFQQREERFMDILIYAFLKSRYIDTLVTSDEICNNFDQSMFDDFYKTKIKK